MITMLLLIAMLQPAPPLERRCGWLHNPTPGNWWLVDRAGQWTLSTQGAPPVSGWEDLGGSHGKEWVATNGSYGYGCACATLRTDKGEVLEIRSLTPRPLKACRTDRRLPKP